MIEWSDGPKCHAILSDYPELEDEDQVAALDGLGAGEGDPGDGAGLGRGDRGLHLHRLDGRDHVTGGDLVALRDVERDHALERRGDLARVVRVSLLGGGYVRG